MAKNPAAKALEAIAKKLPKAKPDAAYKLLYEAFTFVAASGDEARAAQLIELMYGGRLPPPKNVATALSTQALDAYCAAAGLGDRTKGQPRFPPTNDAQPPLEERALMAGRAVRWRLTNDRYQGNRLVGDAWRALPTTDAWRRINEWRDIQEAAAPTPEGDPGPTEASALPLVDALLRDLGPDERGAGYGDELLLGLDVALRHGREDLARAWLAAHGRARLQSDAWKLEAALCLPDVARAITRGLLRETIGLSDAELGAALSAIDAALPAPGAAAPAKKPKAPKVQKRRVPAEASQVHLEPEELSDAEKKDVFFTDARDSAQGMSLFPTRVGIATPTDTAYVDAEVTVDPAGPAELEGAVQAVAFPIAVDRALCLRSVGTGEDEEPLVIAAGRYDVLARFFPKKAPRSEAASGLRVFTLKLSFRPAGSLSAPRCLALEDGTAPPSQIHAG